MRDHRMDRPGVPGGRQQRARHLDQRALARAQRTGIGGAMGQRVEGHHAMTGGKQRGHQRLPMRGIAAPAMRQQHRRAFAVPSGRRARAASRRRRSPAPSRRAHRRGRPDRRHRYSLPARRTTRARRRAPSARETVPTRSASAGAAMPGRPARAARQAGPGRLGRGGGKTGPVSRYSLRLRFHPWPVDLAARPLLHLSRAPIRPTGRAIYRRTICRSKTCLGGLAQNVVRRRPRRARRYVCRA